MYYTIKLGNKVKNCQHSHNTRLDTTLDIIPLPTTYDMWSLMRSWDGMMGLDWKSRSDDVQTEFQLIDSSENTGKEQTLSKAVQDFSSPAAVAVPRGLPLIRLHSILFSLLLPKPPSDLAHASCLEHRMEARCQPLIPRR